MEIEAAAELTEAGLVREQYIKDYQNSEEADAFAKALELDKDKFITFFKLIGRRTSKTAYLQSYK
ncbi:hypothetical protein [Pontibacter sp. BAB1700]|uniref:hypothetical protein n=1 Tax=Pontibacter sp. BAB1700 TaxID=1144253 RepID=UPI00026BDD8D|nr:hypothetical protein [Pontibacter sp. BAB1700]EJF09987.1 hypothetical protein O71_11871 [Pontibacter sp. BAB1700]